MASPGELYIDLLAFASDTPPAERLEARVKKFLENDPTTEALDSASFAVVNGSSTKADYLLGQRAIVSELKTINSDPSERTEQRLRERFAHADAPIVFGTLPLSNVISGLHDCDDLAKMLVDVAGRAVRRHLQKANEQIAAIKTRFDLPNAGGLVVLLNDTQPMIDAGAIGYSIKSAFENVSGGYPDITNVWASIESHKIRMPDGRKGYPQLHIFKSLERQGELAFIARMLDAWARINGSRIERIAHKGDWETMRPIYEGGPPTVGPWS